MQNHQQLCVNFLSRGQFCCVAEGSKYAHWIGLYLSFYLSLVLGPFVHGRLQNLKTSEDTFDHDITSLRAEASGLVLLHMPLRS